MSRKSFALCLCMFVLMFVVVTPAMADTWGSVGGAGAIPGDWDQGINEAGVIFNATEIFMETPGITLSQFSFSDPSWSATQINSQYVQGTGNESSNLTFYLGFSSAASVPFQVDLFALLNGVQVDAAGATWDGSGWTFVPETSKALSAENTSPVPEPMSLVMLGSGLIGFAGFMRRKLMV